MVVTLSTIQSAHSRLRGIAIRPPLIELNLSTEDSRRLFLKPENLQPIGAFKLRGAYNKIASLSPEERSRGVITYSSGNHGQGVAYAARALGAKAVIVMPANAPAIKREATASMGAEIVLVPVGGGGMLSGVATAIKLSKPGVKVIGVEPDLAADAQASLRSGKI